MKDIEKLDNWDEVTRGLYRFHVLDNLDFEIHVVFHNRETDILTSKCRIYIVGEYKVPGKAAFFERGFLTVGPLAACLEKAKLYNTNIHMVRKEVD